MLLGVVSELPCIASPRESIPVLEPVVQADLPESESDPGSDPREGRTCFQVGGRFLSFLCQPVCELVATDPQMSGGPFHLDITSPLANCFVEG